MPHLLKDKSGLSNDEHKILFAALQRALKDPYKPPSVLHERTEGTGDYYNVALDELFNLPPRGENYVTAYIRHLRQHSGVRHYQLTGIFSYQNWKPTRQPIPHNKIMQMAELFAVPTELLARILHVAYARETRDLAKTHNPGPTMAHLRLPDDPQPESIGELLQYYFPPKEPDDWFDAEDDEPRRRSSLEAWLHHPALHLPRKNVILLWANNADVRTDHLTAQMYLALSRHHLSLARVSP